MTTQPPPTSAPDEFLALLAALRPRLHRYCARMAGSALDGEDIVQEALAKAALHYDPAVVRQAEAWLFRIAHNAALDFLRRRTLERSLFVASDDHELAVADDAEDPQAAAETAAAALAAFMHLPVAQRSAVILADVDRLRALLAQEVRLQLAGRLEMKGKAEVSTYFGNMRASRDGGWSRGWSRGARRCGCTKRMRRGRRMGSCWSGATTGASRASGTSGMRAT